MLDFQNTAAGPAPLVGTEPAAADRLGTILARLGLNRDHYLVAPGLYGVGNPDKQAPVVVTANYKLSFDALRYALKDHSAWLLVLDTHGINVWCAAGKGTFSTGELVQRIRQSGLHEVVSHRRLVVPQLGATGVAAHLITRQTGFKVSFGPIRATDLPRFLDSELTADPDMRRVTFNLAERAVLVPVEFYLFGRSAWWLLPLLFAISGIGPEIYSLSQAWQRGLLALLGLLTGIGAGAVLVPLLLPWLPGRAFAAKGWLIGMICGALLLMLLPPASGLAEKSALLLWVSVLGSYLGMNFTGSTPYTSPSGVEWEMKKAIPLQLVLVGAAAVLWLAAPFL